MPTFHFCSVVRKEENRKRSILGKASDGKVGSLTNSYSSVGSWLAILQAHQGWDKLCFALQQCWCSAFCKKARWETGNLPVLQADSNFQSYVNGRGKLIFWVSFGCLQISGACYVLNAKKWFLVLSETETHPKILYQKSSCMLAFRYCI